MSKLAVVTGASSGIGLEFAKLCAADGYDVAVVARRADKLQKLKSYIELQYGQKCHVITADLSKSEGPQTVFDETSRLNNKVEVLINNAGFGDLGAFLDTDLEKELQMIDLNVRSLTHLTKLYVREMNKHGLGYICNVASTAAFQPGPYMAVYYATKAYVLSFTEAIASELEDSNIFISALCPGPTDSEFQEVAAMEESPLVKGKKLPSSEQVARYGYKALKEGKVVAIHGFANNLLAQSVRFTPRAIVRSLVKNLQK